MNFHVLTLFPDMVEQGLHTSILGRAVQKGLISIAAVNIREYTAEKHGRVDDYTYGGGAGMLMQAQPVFDAYQAVLSGIKARRTEDFKPVRTIYVTPQGRAFDQKLAGELAREEELIFLCGHYEGIDERVLEEVVTDYVSIGDYVLTGGELAAMVMIDAVSRLVPGVLNNDLSAETESFHNDLLEYPQYSRPEVWHERRVPEVLLSGNHSRISEWRLRQAEERTRKVRPDLYAKYERKQRLIKKLAKDKRNNIHMIESLRQGLGEILYAESGNILLYDRRARVCMALAEEEAFGERLRELLPDEAQYVVVSAEGLKDALTEKGWDLFLTCSQYLYTERESLPVRHKEIRQLTMEQFAYVCRHYDNEDSKSLEGRIRAGALYGAFYGERLLGFAGFHEEGGIGYLYVEEAFRKQGVAQSLESYLVNRMLERGLTPYGHVAEGNTASERLQEKLGFYRAGNRIWWLQRS